METERLILRYAKLGDENEIYELRNSEYVLKYNCMSKVTMEQLREQVKKDMTSDHVFYMETIEDHRVIGIIDLHEDSLRYGVNSLCFSYYLAQEYASKGYMSEALREMLRYCFKERKTEVVSVRVFKENMASRRLVEKLGFINEGCIRRCVKGYQGILYDDLIYSILKEEYECSKE